MGAERWPLNVAEMNESDFAGENLWMDTLQGTNISPKNGILKMIFLFPRWDMLIPWRVSLDGEFFLPKNEKMEMHGGSWPGLLMSSRLEKNPTT